MTGIRLVSLTFVLLSVMLFKPLPVQAQSDSEPLYNVFSLSSEVAVEVTNDLMIATLQVNAEDKDPAALASKINSTMSWAVAELRQYPRLKTQTRDYQTYPRYDTSQVRRLIGWQGIQSIEIETDDFESAGMAIARLQERLQVQSIRMAAKPETRVAAADTLINNALYAFKERALLIQRNMGASSYRVLDVNIQSDQNYSPVYERSVQSYDMMRSAAVAEPALESGTSRVSVQVYGRVQLQ